MIGFRRRTEPEDRARYRLAQESLQDIIAQMVAIHAHWKRESGRIALAQIEQETRREALNELNKETRLKLNALQGPVEKVLEKNGFNFWERIKLYRALCELTQRDAENKGDARNALMDYYFASLKRKHGKS